MDDECTFSNWKNKKLTERQICYAAMDAWVTFHLFEIFKNLDSSFNEIENTKNYSQSRKNVVQQQYLLNGFTFTSSKNKRKKSYKELMNNYKNNNKDRTSYLSPHQLGKDYHSFSMKNKSNDKPNFIYPDFVHY